MRTDSKVENRNEAFVEKASTKIWHEEPSKENPYIEAAVRCHGYDLIELIKKRSYVDVVYLLFRGELPSAEEARLLEQLMIGLINPGPRHPATRAAMNAGVGKTDPVHILPIALTVLGGAHRCAGEVENAMRFIRSNSSKPPEDIAVQLLEVVQDNQGADVIVAPGFGSYYGSINIAAKNLAKQLLLNSSQSTKALKWGDDFSKVLNQHKMGWYHSGVAAAVFSDLGFQPRMGGGLFQLLSAPGLFAHGIEFANKPRTAMPYVRDEDYVITKE